MYLYTHMEKTRLKMIVKNLELLVASLKSEIYSDTQSYTKPNEKDQFGFVARDDDDGYMD